MRQRIYIETSVVSYFTARPSRDLLIAGHQEATRELWPSLIATYDTYVSALVYEEAARGDAEQAAKRSHAHPQNGAVTQATPRTFGRRHASA